VYWCCARLESNRENVAQHFLKLAGYEAYIPKIREQRVRRQRRVEVVSPLFPAYAFIVIKHQWHAARWSIGVLGLIMNGTAPARVPDTIIDEIRRREIRGAIELSPSLGLRHGDRGEDLRRAIRRALSALRRHEATRAGRSAVVFLGQPATRYAPA
jgi:transcriptional antiterminator RfaH